MGMPPGIPSEGMVPLCVKCSVNSRRSFSGYAFILPTGENSAKSVQNYIELFKKQCVPPLEPFQSTANGPNCV